METSSQGVLEELGRPRAGRQIQRERIHWFRADRRREVDRELQGVGVITEEGACRIDVEVVQPLLDILADGDRLGAPVGVDAVDHQIIAEKEQARLRLNGGILVRHTELPGERRELEYERGSDKLATPQFLVGGQQ